MSNKDHNSAASIGLRQTRRNTLAENKARRENPETDTQTQLIERLCDELIDASFNGDFLNCKVAIKSGQKTKWQKFSFVFDSATDCQGARLVGKMRGAYSEHFAKDAFAIIAEFSSKVASLEIS